MFQKTNKNSGANRRVTQNKAPMQRPTQRVDADIKFVDVAQAGYSCDTTGSITYLNGVATGTDFTNRIGRRIRNLRMELFGFFAQNSNTATADNLCRIMVVLDRQPNGGLPAVTDILAASTSCSSVNVNNLKRFSILSDHFQEVGQYNNTATQAAIAAPGTAKIILRMNLGFLTEYLGTAAAITSVATNSLLLLTIGAVPSPDGHVFNCTTRVYFEG